MVRQFEPIDRSERRKFPILKIQDGGRRHDAILKYRKIAISRPWLKRFRQNLAQWCSSTLLTVLAVENLNFENPSWNLVCELICIAEFNTDEHPTEQHWQPVFLFSKPSVSIHVCCSYIELSRSKLHKTGDLQVGNWHVNCQHSSFLIFCFLAVR